MASKDNQLQQILVISISIVAVLLAVGLFMVNSQRKEDSARAASNAQQASEAQTAQRQLQTEGNQFKQWMGFQEADNFDTLQKSFGEDMARYGSTFDENSRFYRTILENIYVENQKLAAGEADAKEEVKDLKKRLLAMEKETAARIAEFENKMKEVSADLAKQRNDFLEQTKKINDEKEQIASRLVGKRDEIQEISAKNTADQIALNDKISKLERATEILQSNQLDPDPFAQPADGLIRWVNQSNGTVWINIGEADELRPQVTFSVYDGNENDAKGAERKGSIEVTRILSDHMAEARITDDEAIRPLLAGDKVYSQVWNRGRQVGFAITGTIDFEKDGRSDLDELKQIIAINNGKVDAVPAEDGTLDGQMSVDTRYLILGEYPEGNNQDGLRTAWNKMSADADTLGVETINIGEFLSLMGWRSERRTVKLGTGAVADDFKARMHEQEVPSTLPTKGDPFRRRKPKPTY